MTVLVPAPARAQAQASSDARLAAYAGRTCKLAYPHGFMGTMDFLKRAGGLYVNLETKGFRSTQNWGTYPLVAAGVGHYSLTAKWGVRFVTIPQATPATIAIQRFFPKGGHDSPVTFPCHPS